MVLDWILIVVGLALLVGGGEALVRGASGLALLARVTPMVVALTVVAAGTSMMKTGLRINRAEGAVLFGGFTIYLVMLVGGALSAR